MKNDKLAGPGLDQRIVESVMTGDDKQMLALTRSGVNEAAGRARARALGMTW